MAVSTQIPIIRRCHSPLKIVIAAANGFLQRGSERDSCLQSRAHEKGGFEEELSRIPSCSEVVRWWIYALGFRSFFLRQRQRTNQRNPEKKKRKGKQREQRETEREQNTNSQAEKERKG
jgi:hypothetical protein